MKFCIDRPLGEQPNKFRILCEFEKLSKHWVDYAKTQKIGQFQIFETKGKLITAFTELTKCYGNGSEQKVMKKLPILKKK